VASTGLQIAVPFLEKRITDDEQGKTAVPQEEEPGGGLLAGAEQPARREQSGKAQGMGRRHQRAIDIAAGQRQQAPRPQHAELAQHQNSRDQRDDHIGRLIDGQEGPDLGQLLLGEGHVGEKEVEGNAPDRERDPPLSWISLNGEKK
jgi:hypothetical protein